MELEHIDFEAMLNNLDDGVWMTDIEGNILYTNTSYQRLCRRSKEWFDTHNAYDLHAAGYTSVCPTMIVRREKRRLHLVQHIVGFDNDVSCDLLLSCTPIFDACGDVKYVLGDVVAIERLNAIYRDAITTKQQITYYTGQPPEAMAPPNIIARSPEMKQVLHMAEQVADVDANVLITGESGVGKNVIAAYIHERSGRGGKPMVEINCAALPETLLEAELFGYERGAFTGALDSGRPGLFEEAAGGTLFLDEINSMPLSLQGALLRAIETKKIRRVGATRDIAVDFRLVTAANVELSQCVRNGTFREDLYYRLNVVSLTIPPCGSGKRTSSPCACPSWIASARAMAGSRCSPTRPSKRSWPTTGRATCGS